MQKKFKFLLFTIFLSLIFLMSSCDEFPKFEGTYIGTATVILHPNEEIPVEFSLLVKLSRDFKKITLSYESSWMTIVFEGEINSAGIFTAQSTGTYEGKAIITTNSGRIDYLTGTYISTIIETHDGVEAARLELLLRKLFMEEN